MNADELKELKSKISEMAEKQDLMILGHPYMDSSVQYLCHKVTASPEIYKIAKNCTQSNILLCGMSYMAENIKAICPGKKVWSFKEIESCPLSEMADENALKLLKSKYPDAIVAAYEKTPALLKLLSDFTVTLQGAVQLAKNMKQGSELIFLPDRAIGEYLQSLSNAKIILWQGFCPVHQRLRPKNILELKEKHQEYRVLVHTECLSEVRDLSDFHGSTQDIHNHVSQSMDRHFIIGAETGLTELLCRQFPEKTFIQADSHLQCQSMKDITPQLLLDCIEDGKDLVEITFSQDEQLELGKKLDSMLSLHQTEKGAC